MSEHMTCEHCSHFEFLEDIGKSYHVGRCRRYPPTYRGDNEKDGWPKTDSDETCGEWTK